MTEIREIPLDKLQPTLRNRSVGGFNEEKLHQLAESIQVVGVQQPAVVRELRTNGPSGPVVTGYQIVAGERRWRAARIAGLAALPCVVRELDDVQVLRIQTIENLQREDVHPLDEADGYQRLISLAGYDVEQLAAEIGRSISYVYQRLKLQALCPVARQMLAEGGITAGHGILIARLPERQQEEVTRWLVDLGRQEPVSVRVLDVHIHQTVLLDLSKAPFKKDDADLVPEVGACRLCPKRTGHNPALFADVGNGSKRDYCLDPACYRAKQDALVDRRRAEIKGQEHLEVVHGYVDYREEQKLPAKVKRPYDWEETRKKEEGAVPCLIVAGPDRGRMTYGKELERYTYQKTPEEKAREKAEREKRKAAQESRKVVWDRIMDVAERLHAPAPLLTPVLRMIARRFWAELGYSQKDVARAYDWKRPKPGEGQSLWQMPSINAVGDEAIRQMSREELRLFLIKASLGSCLDVPSYGPNLAGAERLLEAAGTFGVHAPELVEEVAELEAKRKKLEEPYPEDEEDFDDEDLDDVEEDPADAS